MQESGEMYLETIYLLAKSGAVRSVDIAEKLGYSKPSVSRAVGILKENGYIKVDKDGIILTDSGLSIARKTYERHEILTEFFTILGVDKETSSIDACKIEHVISDKTFEAIKNKVKEK